MTNLDKIKDEAMKRFEKEFGLYRDTEHEYYAGHIREFKVFLLSEIDRAVEATVKKIREEKATFEQIRGKRTCSRHGVWSGDCSCEDIINPFIDDLLQKLSSLKEK